ncbi:stage II sporulation protein M [Caenibacillus caldisaponilyticus]|uniref:stage II sporulation protein M n=1 Tax=Caenibacillus caldisaponilyticus TaxID=1674942 RepID=UPI00098867C7|nr:stage II sporulation protein M [Caenibacillus caldisaponilyticus]
MQLNDRWKWERHVRDNLSIYTFTIVLFLMGIVFGAIIVNSLPIEAKNDLYHYLQRFFGEMAEGRLASSGVLFNESFSHNLRYLGFIWLLGLSIIGLPVIFILLFLKGIVVGFTVGFLVNQMGLHGFWIALASVLPQNLLIIPAFIAVSTASVAFSLKMIRQLLMRTRKTPLIPQFAAYAMLLAATSLLLVAASMIEAYVSPALMKSIIG